MARRRLAVRVVAEHVAEGEGVDRVHSPDHSFPAKVAELDGLLHRSGEAGIGRPEPNLGHDIEVEAPEPSGLSGPH
jgi:hypothetical protein